MSLVFQLSTKYQHWPLSKNLKVAAILLTSIIWKNFKLLTPPKVWVSGFPSVNRNRISALATMKKLKNGCHFINIDHTEIFQMTNPSKVWVSGFQVSMKTEYRSGMVNSKSFVGKVLLRIKWKFQLTYDM